MTFKVDLYLIMLVVMLMPGISAEIDGKDYSIPLRLLLALILTTATIYKDAALK